MQTERDKDVAFMNLIGIATDGDVGVLEELEEKCVEDRHLGFDDVRECFHKLGLPWASVVQEDVSRIESFQPPIYFRFPRDIARDFRIAYGVGEPEQNQKMSMHTLESTDIVRASIERLEREHKKYDVTLAMYWEAGLACPAEQRDFYNSRHWHDWAKAARVCDRFECYLCRANGRNPSPDGPLHVHHLEPIYSAYSRRFEHNFSLGRTRTLCKQCHLEWHQDRSKFVYGFDKETPIPDRAAKLRAAHHDLEECRWCYHRGLSKN